MMATLCMCLHVYGGKHVSHDKQSHHLVPLPSQPAQTCTADAWQDTSATSMATCTPDKGVHTRSVLEPGWRSIRGWHPGLHHCPGRQLVCCLATDPPQPS